MRKDIFASWVFRIWDPCNINRPATYLVFLTLFIGNTRLVLPFVPSSSVVATVFSIFVNMVKDHSCNPLYLFAKRGYIWSTQDSIDDEYQRKRNFFVTSISRPSFLASIDNRQPELPIPVT